MSESLAQCGGMGELESFAKEGALNHMVNQIDPVHIIITYLGLLVALTMHEAVLAMAARWRGDKSPETESRATINPIPHIDIFWTVILPLLILFSGSSFLIGGAKPLNFDTRYFRNLKKDINIISLFGIASNFTIALIAILAIRLLGYAPSSLTAGEDPVPRLLYAIAMGNVFIGVFNILPFPGRDCWRMIINNAPFHISRKLEENANILSIVFLILLLMGFLRFIFLPFLGIAHYLLFG